MCNVCGQSYTVRCHPDSLQDCPVCSKYKVCVNCGDKFLPKTSKQVFCNALKQKECSICGKEFSYACGSSIPQVCSPECQAKLIVKNRTKSALSSTRVCKWCGKEFQPKDHRQVYCEATHYQKCVICGIEFVIDPAKDPYVRTCSKECTSKLMSQNHDYAKGTETLKQTLLAKYGVDNQLNL